jgi:hypothetical protein
MALSSRHESCSALFGDASEKTPKPETQLLPWRAFPRKCWFNDNER